MLRATWRLCVPSRTYSGRIGTPAGLEGALVAGRAVAARLEAERVGRLVADEGDPPVAELEQVPRRELAAGDVVDHDARQPSVPRVDEHARDRLGAEPSNLLVRWDQGDDEQAVRAMGVGEQAKRTLLTIRRLDVVESEVVGRRGERGDDPADALDRRGLREERQHDADHERPPEREVLGDRARAVLETADRLEHPLPCRSRDVPAVVDDARDGGDPDARPCGDVGDPRGRFGNRFHSE